MNTILHFVDSALMYKRGKETGLAGLVGVILAILVAVYWDNVLPILKFVGIVSLLDSMGLIVDGAPEMTVFRLFVASIALSLGVMLLGGILLLLMSIIVSVTQHEFFPKLFIGIAFIAFFPVVLLYWVLLSIQYLINLNEKRKDPEGYAERKRLEINKDVINYFINAGIKEEKARLEKEGLNGNDRSYHNVTEEKDNILTFEEAYDRLNRIPTMGDYFFLLGVTYERELCILIPKPVAPKCQRYTDQPNSFIGEKIILSGSLKEGEFLLDEHQQYVRSREYPDTTHTQNLDFDPYYHTFTFFNYDEIEMFIDLKRATQLHPKLQFYKRYKHYQHYVENIQFLYFSGKNYLKQKINGAETAADFDKYVAEIKKYNASNEGAVQYIWEQERQAKLNEGLT